MGARLELPYCCGVAQFFSNVLLQDPIHVRELQSSLCLYRRIFTLYLLFQLSYPSLCGNLIIIFAGVYPETTLLLYGRYPSCFIFYFFNSSLLSPFLTFYDDLGITKLNCFHYLFLRLQLRYQTQVCLLNDVLLICHQIRDYDNMHKIFLFYFLLMFFVHLFLFHYIWLKDVKAESSGPDPHTNNRTRCLAGSPYLRQVYSP